MGSRRLGRFTARFPLRERVIVADVAAEPAALPNVDTWSFTSIAIFQEKALTGLVYNDDGSRIYVGVNNATLSGKIMHNTPNYVTPYTPVDDTSPVNILTPQRATERLREIGWSSDGTKVYAAELAAGVIEEFDNTGTPFNPGPGDLTQPSSDTFAVTGDPLNIFVRPDGSEIYYINNVDGDLYQITLSTPDDLTTAAMGDKFAPAEAAFMVGVVFGDNGETLYLLGLDALIYEYSLSTAWDITSASYTLRSKDLNPDMPAGTTAFGLAVSPDKTNLIVALTHTTPSSNGIMYFTI